VTAWTVSSVREPSLSLIIVTEGEVRLMRCEGPDFAQVSARQEQCIGHDMTEGEVRLMRRGGPELARVNARLEHGVGPDLTEEESA
jgi:hypothetical protein